MVWERVLYFTVSTNQGSDRFLWKRRAHLMRLCRCSSPPVAGKTYSLFLKKGCLLELCCSVRGREFSLCACSIIPSPHSGKGYCWSRSFWDLRWWIGYLDYRDPASQASSLDWNPKLDFCHCKHCRAYSRGSTYPTCYMAMVFLHQSPYRRILRRRYTVIFPRQT